MMDDNVFLTSKVVRHKLYGDFQSLLIFTYYWKDFFMYFVTCFLPLVDWKDDSYDVILVIID